MLNLELSDLENIYKRTLTAYRLHSYIQISNVVK